VGSCAAMAQADTATMNAILKSLIAIVVGKAILTISFSINWL